MSKKIKVMTFKEFNSRASVGRPKSEKPKTVIGRCRLTEEENEMITKRFGSFTTFVRWKLRTLNKEWSRDTRRSK